MPFLFVSWFTVFSFLSDVLVALIENNLGFVYKSVGEFASAKDSYERALLIRSTTMGEKHPETIVAMHNLAECLLASGKQQEANALQQKILDLTAAAAEVNEAAREESSSSPSSETRKTQPEKPLSAAMIPNEDNRVRQPTPAEIVKRADLQDKENDKVVRPPPITFQRRPTAPATRKKLK